MKYDVIIIGGGPVGLFTANLLAKEKISTLVLEKEIRKKESSKAIGITPPSLKILQAAGVDKQFIKNGVKVEKVFIHGTKSVLGSISFLKLNSAHKYILSIPQNETEKVLEQNLKKLKCAVLKRGFEAFFIELKNNEISIKTKNTRTRKIEIFYGKYLVACDGKSSFTRNFFNMSYNGGKYKDTFLMADFIDKSGLKNNAHLFFTEKGPVESFPLPKGLRRWIISTEKYLKNPKKGFLESEVFKRCVFDLKQSKKITESPFGVQHHIIDKYYYKKQVLFCGDSAHVMSPIGGQGMNTGFADAELSVKVIKKILSGSSNVNMLFDRFDYYRKKAAKNAIARARNSMFVGTIKGKISSGVRNIIIFIFIRIAKDIIPPYFSMLTIPFGTFNKINTKDRKLFIDK